MFFYCLVNPNRTGFYRVRYNSEILRNSLIHSIQNKSLSVTDRLGIENDAFALSIPGINPTTEFLNLLIVYKDENDYSVWSDLSSNLNHLFSLLKKYSKSNEISSKTNVFCKNLYSKISKTLGNENSSSDSNLTIQLRALILKQLGFYHDEETIQEARKRFNDFINDKIPIHADFRSFVYQTVAQHGDEEIFDAIYSIAKETDFQEEKSRCMKALASFENENCLKKVLDLSLSSDIRAQDSCSIIRNVATNIYGFDLAWEFVKSNWDTLTKIYPPTAFIFNSLISDVVSSISSEDKIDEIQAFFKENNFSSRALTQAFEEVRTNFAWMNRDFDSISNWLAEHAENF